MELYGLGKKLCVPKNKAIREVILREAHEFAYSIHPKSTKMYLDLKEKYWWYGLKRDVAEYVAICDNIRDVINTCDGTFYNLSAYVCD